MHYVHNKNHGVLPDSLKGIQFQREKRRFYGKIQSWDSGDFDSVPGSVTDLLFDTRQIISGQIVNIFFNLVLVLCKSCLAEAGKC